jgi:hypothetical protein
VLRTARVEGGRGGLTLRLLVLLCAIIALGPTAYIPRPSVWSPEEELTMPNRQQRRANDPTLDKWLEVTDDYENKFEIFLRDVSGKDEFDFQIQTQGHVGGLCDLFLKGEPSLVNVAGLIWSQRRKHEKKLTVMEVLRSVSMATIETMVMHDPEEDEEDALESLPADDPQRKLAEMRAAADQSVPHESGEGLPGFGERSGRSGPSSEPSTD